MGPVVEVRVRVKSFHPVSCMGSEQEQAAPAITLPHSDVELALLRYCPCVALRPAKTTITMAARITNNSNKSNKSNTPGVREGLEPLLAKRAYATTNQSVQVAAASHRTCFYTTKYGFPHFLDVPVDPSGDVSYVNVSCFRGNYVITTRYPQGGNTFAKCECTYIGLE